MVWCYGPGCTSRRARHNLWLVYIALFMSCMAEVARTDEYSEAVTAACGPHATVKGGWCVCALGAYAFNMSQHPIALKVCGPLDNPRVPIRKQPNHHLGLSRHCLCQFPDTRVREPSYRCGDPARPNTIIVNGSCECISGAIPKDISGGDCMFRFQHAIDATPLDNECGCFLKSWEKIAEYIPPSIDDKSENWGNQTLMMEKRRRDTRVALERLASVGAPREGMDIEKCMNWMDVLDKEPLEGVSRVWMEARRRAGLPPLSQDQFRKGLRHGPNGMHGFFTSVFGNGGAMVLRYDNNRHQIAYVRNFKAGNDMIRANLHKWGLANNVPVDGDIHLITEDYPATPIQVVFEFESRTAVTWAERFTFVRDPLSRFVSGYKEVAYRAHALGHGPPEFRIMNHTAAVIMTIEALLDGRWRNMSTDMVHVFPQSGHLHSWGFNFIGRLENLETEWGVLRDRLPGHKSSTIEAPEFPFPTWEEIEPEMGQHPEDKQQVYKDAILTVFEQRPDLLAGVLGMLEPDIACFGLLPQKTRSRAVHTASQQRL